MPLFTRRKGGRKRTLAPGLRKVCTGKGRKRTCHCESTKTGARVKCRYARS